MTRDEALKVADDVVAAVSKWGKQARVPYTLPSLYEVIGVLNSQEAIGPPSAQELTKVKRQLAACNARVTKLSNKGGKR